MTHVVGIGYVGSIEDLCTHLSVFEDDLEDLLEENNLILFDLEDDQIFITHKEKYELIDSVCTPIDDKTTCTSEEIQLLKALTGLTDLRLKICQLRDAGFDDQLKELIEGLQV